METKTSPEQNLAAALEALRLHRWALAAQLALTVLRVAPDLPMAMLVLGIARHGLDDPAALETLARAVALAPQEPQFHFNYAVTLAELGHVELAMVEYRACLALDPDFKDALWNHGEMLRLAGHFAAALACFDRLDALESPRRLKLMHRMAVCCAHLGLNERAEALFQQELADPREPGDPQTHWEYALFLLGCGRLDEAWPHYAQRFKAGKAISVVKTDLGVPEWQGQYEAGATLLVQGEQGVGDEILFAAFLPALLARAKEYGLHVVIACRPALQRLFAYSFPEAEVLPPQAAAELAAAGRGTEAGVWQLSMGDLPLWIAKPAPAAYLRPHPDDVILMRLALEDCAMQGQAPGPRVGLAWGANPAVLTANRQTRNVSPQLINAFGAALFQGEFFSLQTTEHRPALAHMPDLHINDMSTLLSDFSRTAALMQELDTVVTVCTSTANLAGALGLPVRVLLQKHADWRWHGDTAWYPKARCYRQKITGDWSGPLQQLFSDLSSLTFSQ